MARRARRRVLVGGATAAFGVGLGVLVAVLALSRAAAEVERHLANTMVDAAVPTPVRTVGPPGPHAVRRLLRQPRTWRAVAWLLFRGVAGLLVVGGAAVSAVVLAALLALPFVDGYLQWGPTWRSTAGWAGAWALPTGLAGLLALAHLVGPVTAVHVRVARLLLGPDPGERVAELEEEQERAEHRARLARDLHDGIGHALTVVVVQADAARLTTATDPDRTGAALASIAQAGRAALDDLDRALSALRADAPLPGPEPTLAQLPRMIDRARAAGLPVTVARLHPGAADHPAGAVGYRIVQEACTNVLRHGDRAPTTVDIDVEDQVLRLSVRNRVPAGRSGSAPPGRGLTGLAERARLAGGALTAGATDDGHWLVQAELPAAPR